MTLLPKDQELRARVQRAFDELTDHQRKFRLTEFHVYRENTEGSLVGYGSDQFPEITLDEQLVPSKVRIEGLFEEVPTERRVIASVETTIGPSGTFEHSSAIEISYIDTLEGEAGVDGTVPDEKLEQVTSAIPKLCGALISILNAVLNLRGSSAP